MQRNGVTRALGTLLGAAIAGVLLWLAGRIGRGSIGGYWAAYGVIAAAGFAFGLSQLRGRGGEPRAMLGLAFLPVLIVAGWVLVALQPTATTTRDHVLVWSSNMGISDVVYTVGTWLGVLAFGIGYTLAAAVEPPALRRRTRRVEPVDRTAADAPTTAERDEVSRPRLPRRQPVPR